MLKIERTRSIARENFLVLSAIFNRANYCQKENKVPHLIYAKLFLNTIINGNTQTSFLRFFPGRGGYETGYFDIKLLEISNDECKNIFPEFREKRTASRHIPKFSEFSHRDILRSISFSFRNFLLELPEFYIPMKHLN